MDKKDKLKILKESFDWVEIRNAYSPYRAIKSRKWLNEIVPKYQILEELGDRSAPNKLWKEMLREIEIPPLGVKPLVSVVYYSQQGVSQFVSNLAYKSKEVVLYELDRREKAKCDSFRSNKCGVSWDWVDKNALRVEFTMPRVPVWPKLLKEIQEVIEQKLQERNRRVVGREDVVSEVLERFK